MARGLRASDGRSPRIPRPDGEPWREHDYRNWRRRVFNPAAVECGVSRPRPYDLRHSFASLLLHERRLSIVEIAEQLGHSPTTTLKIYAHVIAELRDARRFPRRTRSAPPGASSSTR